jgi:hypothetical protein
MIIKFILKIKSCDIYVYVYSLKIYTEIFEIYIIIVWN